VAPYVLLPGDPDRVGRIGKHLQEARGVADHREFRTWTGSYHGMPVSATSTGIGCPSAAIAVEELANVGATHFIRVGSTGALQPEMRIGDLVVTVGAMRNEGTSLFYVPDGFPAVADHFLTRHLVDAARDLAASRGFRLWVGLTASDDAFYGESPELIERMSHLGLLSLEMEASAIFTVAHRRGLQAASVCAVSGNLITGEVVYERENDRLARGWDDAIDVALEAVRAHHSTRDTER